MQRTIVQKIINNILCKGKKRTAEKILLITFKELNKTLVKQFLKVLKLFVVFCLFVFKQDKIKNKQQNNKKIKKTLKIIKFKHTWIFVGFKFVVKYLKSKTLKFIVFNLHWQIFLNVLNKSAVFEKKLIMQKQVALKKSYYYYYYWW